VRRLPATAVYFGLQLGAHLPTWVVMAVYLVRELHFSPLQLVLMGTAMEAAVRPPVVTLRLVSGPPTAPVKVVLPEVFVVSATELPVTVDPKNKLPPDVEERVVGVAVSITGPM